MSFIITYLKLGGLSWQVVERKNEKRWPNIKERRDLKEIDTRRKRDSVFNSRSCFL